MFPTGRYGDLTPQDIQEMMDYIQSYRTTTGPFDVVVGGRMYEKGADEAAEALAHCARTGVTWWLESFWADTALENVEAVIHKGPPAER